VTQRSMKSTGFRGAAITLFVILQILTVVGCSDESTSPGNPPPMAIDWHRCNFDSVMAAASSSRQDLLVHATATWCGPCQYFSDSSWADPRVVSFVSRHMTAFEVDLTNYVEFMNPNQPYCPGDTVVYDVLGTIRGIPATFIVRNGAITHRLIGYRPSGDLFAWLVDSYLDR